MNKQALYERIRTMLLHIESKIVVSSSVVTDLLYQEAEYKVGSQCPRMDESNSGVFRENDVWGGALDQHAWFYKHITLPPKSSPDNRLELTVQTKLACSLTNLPNRFLPVLVLPQKQWFESPKPVPLYQ